MARKESAIINLMFVESITCTLNVSIALKNQPNRPQNSRHALTSAGSVSFLTSAATITKCNTVTTISAPHPIARVPATSSPPAAAVANAASPSPAASPTPRPSSAKCARNAIRASSCTVTKFSARKRNSAQPATTSQSAITSVMASALKSCVQPQPSSGADVSAQREKASQMARNRTRIESPNWSTSCRCRSGELVVAAGSCTW
ncbi:hypothetical protein BC830DRAFT_256755 [Chytriomyces sp. MP71]|nr:hypothetical protein BC830DRAFT_256755 [Chytriomyces sp. MP71]